MSTINNLVAAIDIGTTKIVTLIGRMNNNHKLEILGISRRDSTGVKRGVVQNIDETVNSIAQTVIEVEKQSGLKLSEVFVGIAGQHIRSIKNRGYINRDSTSDQITKSDLTQLIEDMYKIPIEVGEEIIHVIPQSYIVDNEPGVKNPVGMLGRRLEANFHIVIGQVTLAKNSEKCVNQVGLEVKSLMLEPLASASAVLTADEMEAGVALVDIGGGTTDLAVYYDDILRHTAVIPFGGNVITKDIKEGCAILQRQAELLKVQYGSALGDLAPEDKVVSIPGIAGREPKEISFKNLAYIIQSRMEEILDAVCFEIENSGYMDKLSAGIVITGGGSMLRHLPQLVKFKTGLDVRVGYPNEHLSVDAYNEINHPMFSTAIGLLIKGYEFYKENNIQPAAAHRINIETIPENPIKEITFDINEEKNVEIKNETEHEIEKNTTPKSKVSFLDSIKKTFNEIFDEDNSVKM